MENVMDKQDNKNNIDKIKKGIEDTQKAAKSAASLAANVGTGNVAGAAKDAIKLAANKKVRRKIILKGCFFLNKKN